MKSVRRERASAMLVLALVSILSSRADGRSWIVAQDGSGDFTLVRQACLAAASGDSVIVRPGTYQEPDSAIYLDGKPLSILGAGAGPDDVRLKLALGFSSGEDFLIENLSFIETRPALLFHGGSGTVRRCAVRDCAGDGWYPPLGAIGGARVLIENTLFAGNQNTWSYHPEYCYGGAISGSNMTIRNCLFVDNIAAANGGAVFLWDSTIENCVFFRNAAPNGAAISVGGDATVRNCTLLANRVTVPGGAALEMNSNLDAERSHLIVAGTVGGAAVDCLDTGPYRCCDFWNNDGGDYVGWLCGISESRGDFSQDPLFCDPSVGDVGLREGSPCLPGTHGGVECGLIGARDVGCGLAPTRNISWGMLKALYR